MQHILQVNDTYTECQPKNRLAGNKVFQQKKSLHKIFKIHIHLKLLKRKKKVFPLDIQAPISKHSTIVVVQGKDDDTSTHAWV